MSNDPPAPESWRSNVAQSYRSSEVRSIATVLAELEPGATSASKTMLAMRFEESIFKAANSLDDYKKTIEKRLKKLRKHYSKQQASTGGDAANDELKREKELLLENELREKYGPKLKYIIDNYEVALKASRDNSNDNNKKTDILESHCRKLKDYAAMLGLLPDIIPKVKSELTHLTKIKDYLEKFIDHIRDHITKFCDPERFLMDTLAKFDATFIKQQSMSDKVRKALQDHDKESPQFTPDALKRLMDKMNDPLPIPKRNEEGGPVKVALAKIERFRAAAAALYNFWGLRFEDRTAFQGCSKKCTDVALKCLLELEQEYDSLVKELDDTDENGKHIIQLEDAWNNTMQFPDSDVSLDIDEPDAKRQKTEETHHSIVIRSKVLLTPGRPIISSILPVLKRKRASLVRSNTASYVELEFGKAFVMKIFFVPLLVTIRAVDEKEQSELHATSLGRGLRWPSLHQGLHGSATQKNMKDLTVLGVTAPHTTLGNIVAKKLEYASSQATLVLRRCFAETVSGKGGVAKTEFEVEILEVGALVKFLQIARSTYIPEWVDDE